MAHVISLISPSHCSAWNIEKLGMGLGMRLALLAWVSLCIPVVTPAVQLLQIQEVHLGPQSNACNFCRFFYQFSYLFYLGHFHFQDSKQRPENKSTLLLSSGSSPIARRRPWAPQWTFLCMLFTSARKSASCKKWHILVPLNGFPWFKYHSVALVLL